MAASEGTRPEARHLSAVLFGFAYHVTQSRYLDLDCHSFVPSNSSKQTVTLSRSTVYDSSLSGRSRSIKASMLFPFSSS